VVLFGSSFFIPFLPSDCALCLEEKGVKVLLKMSVACLNVCLGLCLHFSCTSEIGDSTHIYCKVEIQVSECTLKLGRDPSHPMKLTIYFLAIVFLFLPSVEKASAEKTGLC